MPIFDPRYLQGLLEDKQKRSLVVFVLLYCTSFFCFALLCFALLCLLACLIGYLQYHMN
jgi:hypothetical protein